jgi:SAM-dependent methyltransferase
MDWTAGYRADIDYNWTYYRDLAPGHIDFCLLLAGLEPPERSGLRYLELGYGQGLASNIHAAACPGEFFGVDFNPSHAANSREMARVAGAGADFTDASFAELAERDDLPPMDHIVMHGVWSWITDENRRLLVETYRRRLKVGGVLYMSFNVFPGWAAMLPVRHILGLHARGVGHPNQGEMARIEAALAFGKQLADTGARYFQIHPSAVAQLNDIGGQPKAYVAHEYFNDHSRPMYFSEIHDALSEAKLSYAGSAQPIEQFDGFNLTAAQQGILAGFPAGDLRETVRDFLVNATFRRDLFTRGAKRLTPLERHERMSALRIALTVEPANVRYEVQTPLGKVGLKEEIYRPIVEALADGGGPKRLSDFAASPKVAALPTGALLESLAVLVGSGQAHPALSDEDIAAAKPRTDRLNAYLMDRSRISGDATALASPVIGAGVFVGRFEQMFLGARARGLKTPKDWASDVWNTLARQSQALIKDGKLLETPEANQAELLTQATAMADTRLGEFKRLAVVD